MLHKLHLYQITNKLSVRSNSLDQLRLTMQEDDEIVLVKNTMNKVSNVLQPYWTFKEELTVEDGLALKGTKIVIPNKKCEAILKVIHEGHLGLNKCKLCIKCTVYWPGLNDQLEKIILNCEPCLKYTQSNHKQQPSMSWRCLYMHGQNL